MQLELKEMPGFQLRTSEEIEKVQGARESVRTLCEAVQQYPWLARSVDTGTVHALCPICSKIVLNEPQCQRPSMDSMATNFPTSIPFSSLLFVRFDIFGNHRTYAASAHSAVDRNLCKPSLANNNHDSVLHAELCILIWTVLMSKDFPKLE